jgi:3-oxoadipate enol-lactonase
MPHLQLDGVRLHYEDTGRGVPVVFAHGLLWSGRMFDAQVAALKGQYRCVTFDFRGQGQSEVTEGGYDLDALAGDAIGVIERLAIGPVHFVGLSMGGMVGMRLAARRPELIRSLTLLETSADPEPEENVPKYRRLNLVARWLGLRLVASKVMPIMFGRKFLDDPARAAERAQWRERLIANHRVGITRAVVGVITRAPVLEELSKIRAPTLVMVGDQDVATVPAKARRIQERIAGARLEIIPGAGHTSTIEEPAAINAQLAAFLAAH